MTYKILSVEADNIKRLKVVRLNLDGKPLTVTGRPDEGKTTAIDLFYMAMKAKAIGEEVITHGEDEGQIKVMFGNPQKTFTVTRKLKRDGDRAGKMTIKCSDGAHYPAKFLDDLVSELTFDPTGFCRADGKRQVDMLLQVVKLPDGLTLEEVEATRAKLYEERTGINRDVDRLKSKLLGVKPAKVEEVKVAEVLESLDAELEKARATNQANTDKRNKLAALEKERIDLTAKMSEMEAQFVKMIEAKKVLDTRIASGTPIVAALEDVDCAPIALKRRTAVEDAEKTNAQARAFQDWDKQSKELEAVQKSAADLTEKIQAVDISKEKMLAAVAWPVEGLGIRYGNVTYNGTILNQCGTSVRMRVSCAIAMAMNPKLTTIRVDEGESLGAEGRDELLKWAAEKDFQVLMTVVKDGAASSGELEIVDGTLMNGS